MQEDNLNSSNEGFLKEDPLAPYRTKLVFVIVLAALVVSMLVVGVLLIQNYVSIKSQTSEPIKTQTALTTDFVLKGYLVFNFATGENGSKELYTYNTENGDLYHSPLNLRWPVESYDGAIALGSKLFTEGENVVSGLFSFSDAGEKLVYASNTQATLFSNPKISGSGTKYTFSVSPDVEKITEHAQRFLPSEWKLFYGEIDGAAPKHIANGPSALFSPDESKLLYLADDGFHLFNLLTSEDVPIPDLAQDYKLTYVMADISHDGRTLAVTSSPTEEVIVYTIRSWDPFEIEIKYELPGLAYWPVISPDGNFLSFMQFDWVGDHPGNRRVVVVDLRTGKLQELEGLSEFTKTDFYISDWIN